MEVDCIVQHYAPSLQKVRGTDQEGQREQSTVTFSVVKTEQKRGAHTVHVVWRGDGKDGRAQEHEILKTTFHVPEALRIHQFPHGELAM